MSISPTSNIVAGDFIDEVTANNTPSADVGRVVKLNTNTKLSKSLVESEFGGDGSDGVINVTAGVTNIDLLNEKIVVLNYVSFSVTGSGQVKFINPHSSGTLIIVKVLNDVTITSTATPAVVCNCGASGYKPLVSGDSGKLGNDGQIDPFVKTNKTQVVASQSFSASVYALANRFYASGYTFMFVGAGGTSGGWADDTGAFIGTGGQGGTGGGALAFEVGRNWESTSVDAISCSGDNGGNGIITSNFGTVGGGGGGGGGSFFAKVFKIIADTGGRSVTGGIGGNTSSNSVQTTSGGAGGSSFDTIGGNGVSSSINGAKTGGDGGNGKDYGVITK